MQPTSQWLIWLRIETTPELRPLCPWRQVVLIPGFHCIFYRNHVKGRASLDFKFFVNAEGCLAWNGFKINRYIQNCLKDIFFPTLRKSVKTRPHSFPFSSSTAEKMTSRAGIRWYAMRLLLVMSQIKMSGKACWGSSETWRSLDSWVFVFFNFSFRLPLVTVAFNVRAIVPTWS